MGPPLQEEAGQGGQKKPVPGGTGVTAGEAEGTRTPNFQIDNLVL